MENLQITSVKGKKQIAELAWLADIIWHEHFTPIIGEAQVAYMLDKFQCTRFPTCCKIKITDIFSLKQTAKKLDTSVFSRVKTSCF